MAKSDKKLTITEVARLARVSITTVSRVINNEGVGEKTKERVLKIIKVYEYSPNSFAQYLGRRSHVRFISRKRKRFRKI